MRLTKIYTRTGDDGSTGLGDFSRTHKTDPRLIAYADTDETGAAIGLAITLGAPTDGLRSLLQRVQNDLFDVGADLCMPLAEKYDYQPLRVGATWISELESDIDKYNADLPTLTTFVLAGGTPLAAYLHQARTVCRRAERSAWAAIEEYGTDSDGVGVNPDTAKYLNRLSDLLFVLSRYANHAQGDGDVLWQPGGGRENSNDR